MFYVDGDYNGGQRDFPYLYCTVSLSVLSKDSDKDNEADAIAIAFDWLTGRTAIKVLSGIGSERDYPWKEMTLQGWLNSYSDLSSLANALGAQGIEITISQELINNIKVTYDAVSSYSTFEGNTMSANEGRWFGYKHGTVGVGIYMAMSVGFCYFKIDNNGNFTIKRLCLI